MIRIETIYICMIAPLLISLLFMPRTRKKYVFMVIAGLTTCLFSAYFNSFYALVYGIDIEIAKIEIAPLIEEVMKFFPVLFYLIIWMPDKKEVLDTSVIIAISFSIFENIYYLLEGGIVDLEDLFIRSFSVPAMHILFGLIVGHGLTYIWRNKQLKFISSLAIICVTITLHGQFNLMMYAGGGLQIVAAVLPIVSLLTINLIKKIKSVKTNA